MFQEITQRSIAWGVRHGAWARGLFLVALALSSAPARAANCGAEGQRACTIFERIPSCNAYLVESGGRCIHPNCGREGQRPCTVFERIPSCDAGLVEANGYCRLPTPCGAEGQRPCKVWERVPSCNAYLIEQPLGVSCVHPNCGREGQAPCTVNVRIPSCDSGLVEANGYCRLPTPCGAEGQRPCKVWERVPSCNAYLIEQPLGVSCVHPNCGREGQAPCTVNVRIPSCDAGLVEANGYCRLPTPCGAEGQRPCKLWERVPSCDVNLIEQPLGVSCVHPACGRLGQRSCGASERVPSCDAGFVERSSFCVDISACGAAGQRACNLIEQAAAPRNSCDPGLVEVHGCHGACLGLGGVMSSGRCFDPNAAFTEPGTGGVTLAPKANDPRRGYADIHLHLFANLAFGGGVMAGEPYNASGGAAAALHADYGSNLDLVAFNGQPIPVQSCPPLIPDCGKSILHGDHIPGIDDTAGLGTGDGADSDFGAPLFNGWPTWHSTVHQQSYYKWLERAWQGGLRLMVMLAVNNEVLCRSSKRVAGADCGDTMKAIDAQLAATQAFQDWLDKQPGGGWFRIVRTPEEADSVIRSGKLAVVLGIEADNLFNCKVHGSCTAEYVSAQLDKYYDMGVRHIFPIHDFDNGFGGTAVWQDILNMGNRLMEGDFYDATSCDADISDFKLTQDFAGLLGPGIGALGTLLDWGSPNVPYPTYPATPHCNRKGLTELGKSLVGKMMDMGMTFDIDHMSYRSLQDTSALIRGRGIGYPVTASHTTFADLYKTPTSAHRSEVMRTREQLGLIREVGGMVGIITTDDKEETVTLQRPAGVPGNPVVDDCVASSKSLAMSYLYATQLNNVSAGFGSDFHGLAPHYGPRFGDDACGADRVSGQWKAQVTAQRLSLEQPGAVIPDRPLAYPFTIDGFGRFDRQVTGQRTFDFNTDGFAHIGLFPDLIADLGNVGVTGAELEPLFHSAAAYVDLWTRARTMAAKPTPAQCASWRASGYKNMVSELCN